MAPANEKLGGYGAFPPSENLRMLFESALCPGARRLTFNSGSISNMHNIHSLRFA
jgi:hypothetical protein